MADKRRHPYVNTIGGLSKAIQHFRNSFPLTVDASTLQKLAIAPNNESYVISTLRFLGFVDDNDRKTDAAGAVFSQHPDEAFAQALSARVADAYSELFDLHGEASWTLSDDQLISYFRGADQTSAVVGRRQASTFRVLARFAGHGESPNVASTSQSRKPRQEGRARPKPTAPRPATKDTSQGGHTSVTPSSPRVGLTVRVEVNLPADGDQDTYDRIFRSIRENLLSE